MKKFNHLVVWGLPNKMKEVNPEDMVGSRYIEENYPQLVRVAETLGAAPDKASDLVNDVYLSIKRKELNGEVYDERRSGSVEGYIVSTIRKYAKNQKYLRPTFDDDVVAVDSLEDIDDIDYHNTEGAVKLAYLDGIKTYDDLDMVIIENDLKEDIEYILQFEEHIGDISLRKILHFISGDISLNIEGIDNTIFASLKRILKYHDELREAFESVVRFAVENPQRYKEALNAIGA